MSQGMTCQGGIAQWKGGVHVELTGGKASTSAKALVSQGRGGGMTCHLRIGILAPDHSLAN
jgi:hypothetical protein